MKQKPVEIRPWRVCPFIPGDAYRVIQPVQSLRDSFRTGEHLTFLRDAYSRYDGMTAYFFRDASGAIRAFDIADDVVEDTWPASFEHLAPGA